MLYFSDMEHIAAHLTAGDADMTHEEIWQDWRKHEAEGMSWSEWVKTPAGLLYTETEA